MILRFFTKEEEFPMTLSRKVGEYVVRMAVIAED
jgi:hypothetical protein